jgi:hypothetical protein
MEKEKPRSLSIYEYLQALQVEYVVAELRRKIYIKKKDTEYYSRVISAKKKKITDICLRNSLPSIFDHLPTKELVYKDVYSEYGFPNFHYKVGREGEEELRAKDFYHYYAKNTEFKVQNQDSFVVGTLIFVDHENKVAKVKVRGLKDPKLVPLTGIARII